MNVLFINGSPHREGCVFTALREVATVLEENGVETDFCHIGTGAIQGCIGCRACRSGNGCVFQDELYTEIVSKIQTCDGLIIGSPVYYAGPAGSLCALLDRVFFSAGAFLKGKPGACVVNCRRGGASATFDRLNKYFTILQMPVVTSQYWNATHGLTPDEVRQDLEGMQTMRTLGRNFAFILRTLAETKVTRPESEPPLRTSFIR